MAQAPMPHVSRWWPEQQGLSCGAPCAPLEGSEGQQRGSGTGGSGAKGTREARGATTCVNCGGTGLPLPAGPQARMQGVAILQEFTV